MTRVDLIKENGIRPKSDSITTLHNSARHDTLAGGLVEHVKDTCKLNTNRVSPYLNHSFVLQKCYIVNIVFECFHTCFICSQGHAIYFFSYF